jgi:hypothetical protein
MEKYRYPDGPVLCNYSYCLKSLTNLHVLARRNHDKNAWKFCFVRLVDVQNHLESRCRKPCASPTHGYQRSNLGPAKSLAKPLCRKGDRLDQARMYRPCHRLERSSPEKNLPDSRPIQSRLAGKCKIVVLPRMGGLHHRYEWKKAT